MLIKSDMQARVAPWPAAPSDEAFEQSTRAPALPAAHDHGPADRAPPTPDPRPILLCLEGPGGVGKSTLSEALRARCERLGLQAVQVAEFSDSDHGRELAERLAYASPHPADWSPFEVLNRCIDDKCHALQTAPHAQVLILDRGYLSQRVLALPFIHDEDEREQALRKLHELEAAQARAFHLFTYVLHLPVDLHRARVERRVQRAMSEDELRSMYEERDLYREYAPPEQLMDARADPALLARHILRDAGLEARL